MSFERIYEEYWQKILRLCMGYVNKHDLANDMAQEIFIKVWQNFSSFRNESSIGTWVFRIATNYCIRQVKSEKSISQSDLSLLLEDTDGDPELENKTQLLYRYIAELPEIDRLIVSLELEDVNQSEIANIIGISDSNVRVRMHRIKKKLEKKFKAN